jgi:hypothetical protein
MHSYRRLAALAASVLTAAIMLGAATPASASVQGNTAVITQNSAPTTSASASYCYYYFITFLWRRARQRARNSSKTGSQLGTTVTRSTAPGTRCGSFGILLTKVAAPPVQKHQP